MKQIRRIVRSSSNSRVDHSSPMRVCMLVTTNVTGDPRVMREAVALFEAGYAVRVIGVRRAPTDSRTEIISGVRIRRLDLWHMQIIRWLKARRGLTVTQGYFRDATAASNPSGRRRWRQAMVTIVHELLSAVDLLTVFLWFFPVGLRQRADIYHTHDVDTLLAGTIIGLMRRTPVIYDAHEHWFSKRLHLPLGRRLIRLIERVCVPLCRQVLTVNRSIAVLMAQDHAIDLPVVLMNVPDLIPEDLKPLPPLRHDEPIKLLYHGGFLIDRGVDTLISAMALIQSPVHLTLRGFGEIESLLKAQVNTLGIQDRVTFEPIVPLNQIVPASIGYHVGVLPFNRKSSYLLALPNKLFEYMAAGLAILTNDLPEIVAIVRAHDLGYVYGSEEPRVLANTIDAIARDRRQLERFRARARMAFVEQYTWQWQRNILLNVYGALEH